MSSQDQKLTSARTLTALTIQKACASSATRSSEGQSWPPSANILRDPSTPRANANNAIPGPNIAKS